MSRAPIKSRGRSSRAGSPSRQLGITLLLCRVASGDVARDEQVGPPGVLSSAIDVTRVMSMLTEDCTPNMRRRRGSRRVGMLPEWVARLGAHPINSLDRSDALMTIKSGGELHGRPAENGAIMHSSPQRASTRGGRGRDIAGQPCYPPRCSTSSGFGVAVIAFPVFREALHEGATSGPTRSSQARQLRRGSTPRTAQCLLASCSSPPSRGPSACALARGRHSPATTCRAE